MSVGRPRLLTLAYGDMETLRMVFINIFLPINCLQPPQLPNTFHVSRFSLVAFFALNYSQELMAAAQEWTKPPPDAIFNLRVPVEYTSIHAAVSPVL
jgi:hypothetical protein